MIVTEFNFDGSSIENLQRTFLCVVLLAGSTWD